MTAAFTFPGQGSQAVGMGKALADAFPAARAIFDEVDAALGEKLTAIIWGGPAETLQLTENAQPALMAVSLATLRVLGYYRREVGTVLLGELALLVVAAVPVGCVMGYWLAQFITAMFSSDLFRLPFSPARPTYGYSILVILAAATVTASVVALRVLKLDMVRVLKAHD